jgi:sugar lactone lactonase YvrE
VSTLPIPAQALDAYGHDLHRPECVLASRAGDLLVPDWRGGVTRVRADGSQQTWFAHAASVDLRPNAVALLPDRSFLLANLGDDGGVWRLGLDESLTPVLTDLDGCSIPPVNFVTVEATGRLWMSVSTRQRPRQLAWRPWIRDGFVIVMDARGARIVADGLHYANEVRPDPSGRWLYAVETFGRRLVRFPIGPTAELGRPEVVVEFGHGFFPDGFAFDHDGGLWVTSLVSNRLVRIGRDSRQQTIVEDVNPTFVDTVEDAFASGTMAHEHLGPIPGTRLQHLTSVAFGGPELRTVYLGSLHARCVHGFDMAAAGRLSISL